MPMNPNDPVVRGAVAGIARRILGSDPSPELVTAIIAELSSKPAHEPAADRVLKAIRAKGILVNESQLKIARSGDIDRVVDEIEKITKPKPK